MVHFAPVEMTSTAYNISKIAKCPTLSDCMARDARSSVTEMHSLRGILGAAYCFTRDNKLANVNSIPSSL